MRKLAIIISIIGLSLLLSQLFTKPLEVSSIENIKVGTLVKIKGNVSEEKDFSFAKTFKVNNTSIICDCKSSYVNKEVEIIGIIEDYYELRVNVLKIKVIQDNN
jgi:hypothetical protein